MYSKGGQISEMQLIIKTAAAKPILSTQIRKPMINSILALYFISVSQTIMKANNHLQHYDVENQSFESKTKTKKPSFAKIFFSMLIICGFIIAFNLMDASGMQQRVDRKRGRALKAALFVQNLSDDVKVQLRYKQYVYDKPERELFLLASTLPAGTKIKLTNLRIPFMSVIKEEILTVKSAGPGCVSFKTEKGSNFDNAHIDKDGWLKFCVYEHPVFHYEYVISATWQIID